jgi:hypothetical protein
MNRLGFGSTAALAAALIVVFAFIPASAHATTFNFSGGIVDYTVLTSGTYDIIAAGAQGGSDHYSPGGNGQTENGCGGGSVTAAGGTNGNGGAGGAYCNDNASPSTGGGSGAGFYSNGGNGGDNWPQFCHAAGGGNDWGNGLGGGGGSGCFNGGGGGGYGGGGGSSAEGGGGGGGGYSGGGGGAGGGSDSAGGGGGSFSVSGLTLSLSESGANSGNGYVDVDLISAATPEPSSIFLIGTGLLGIAGIVLRRRRDRQTHRLGQSLS